MEAQPTTTTTPTINHLTAPSPLTITSTTPTTAAGTPPSSTTTTTTTTTTSRTESISSESTFHENHGLDMQALEKGMSGGMVIAEGDGIPAAVGVHTGQGNEHGFAGVGVVGV
ncbi:hypothetical protein QFC24_000020 [Naganishia onofrii]|uniref:Uncharacterized protein n=1 Tax=Naganishia onofrii TaxID=1851511 RepID=A0ACC2XWS8_9TREE|nr:hypothetical protein QFC24_000020 [Naganishia onofrii]